MKKVVHVAVREASKRSIKVHNMARKVGTERLRKRFKELTKKSTQDDKTVVFVSFMGRGYSDSPLALYREMIKDPYFSDWKFVWVFKGQNSREFIGKTDLAKSLLADKSLRLSDKNELEQFVRATTVVYNTPEYYETLAKAKYWVSNSRIQDGVEPGKNHVYVQTWHGTPLKRLGADIEVGANAVHSTEKLAAIYKQEAEKWSYLLSPSTFYTEKMKTAFLIGDNSPTETLEEGYPRNDYLVNHTEADITRIKKRLNIPADKKVLLYAPTWRDNQHDLKQGYTYELGADFDRLKEELSDDWVILFRAHYFIANSFDFSKYEGFVYNVSNHPDINELYVAADALMTDYSSVFFDYSILERPIVFFMYDKEQYANELRGFYLDLEELPGDIVETNDEVTAILKDISTYEKKHRAELKKFKQRFCCLDDGKAAKRTVQAIFKQGKVN